ncbi:DUF3060 domain-containing protein [Paraburkholderia phenazinium]|uniref:Uncharacterized protein n=1 Tax=Paraburkholderia phenazinium TaxID=60549 RepID=A0A1N6KGV6_9BURK|nr:DUF3060 domain-containing protein [Paraburkholderia phenazinium]SIO55556.1 Protein of unknown function [Paraburkholderia phenazinium]
MNTQNFSEAIADVTAFITGASVSVADATNSAQQALAAQATRDKISATATAANDLFGVVSAGMQKGLETLSPASTEAAELLARAGARSSVLGLSLAGAPILKAVLNGDGGAITTSQLDALSGAALMAGAVSLPEVAVTLTVVGSLMVAASVFDTNPDNTLSNAVTQLKNLIQPYYNQLSPSDQTVFASQMSEAMSATLSGGMLLPQVNEAGWITGYTAEAPASITEEGDAKTYTFASGVTYIIGNVTDDDPLTDSSTGAEKSLWTVPAAGAGSPLTLDIHKDGSYSNSFTDPQGNKVTEVYVAGSSGTYTIAPMNGNYQFIDVEGKDNKVTVQGDNNQISLAAGTQASITGANNTIYADAGTAITLNSASGNTVWNEVTGDNLSISDGILTVAGDPNGPCGGATVTAGTTNSIAIHADGSQTLVTRYDDDDRVWERTYNAADVMTEQLVVSPDGSYGDELFDPKTGEARQWTFSNGDGTGLVLKFDSYGKTIERDYINRDRPSSQFVIDPVTGATTAYNTLSGVSLPTLQFDPATGAVAWSSGSGTNSLIATAYSAADHQAAQLVHAMAVYAPETSASISLAAIPPDNPQLLLAASPH